jgi:hypothetical protein
VAAAELEALRWALGRQVSFQQQHLTCRFQRRVQAPGDWDRPRAREWCVSIAGLPESVQTSANQIIYHVIYYYTYLRPGICHTDLPMLRIDMFHVNAY